MILIFPVVRREILHRAQVIPKQLLFKHKSMTLYYSLLHYIPHPGGSKEVGICILNLETFQFFWDSEDEGIWDLANLGVGWNYER
jgi:hypothetical protein